MILTVDELTGKALDWMYERALHGHYEGIKTEDGQIFIELNDDVNPPGWYYYKSSIIDEEDVYAVKCIIQKRLGNGPFVVPTDLCSPKYAHLSHEKAVSCFGPVDRWRIMCT